MPSVCKFYLKGYCRFGTSCRYLHPGENDHIEDRYASSPAATGFSFRTPPTAIFGTNNQNRQQTFPQQNPISSSGFSFRQPIGSGSSNVLNNPSDVDMSDNGGAGGFSFRQPPQSQPAQPTSVFGTFPQNNNSIFTPNPFQQQFSSQNSGFNQSSPFGVGLTNQPFLNNPAISISNVPSINLPKINKEEYSELNQLSAAEIEAFKGDRFLPGRIPVRAPPEAFCT